MKNKMMGALKYNLLNGWNLMRIFRLGIGIVILVEAIKMQDAVMGILGIILLAQALLNAGCCATIPPYREGPPENKDEDKEITFEEIKTTK